MKRRKQKKKGDNEMSVKPETTWEIVKNADGSFKWYKVKRGK